MDFGKAPDQGTIALILVTATITTLVVGVFGKKLAEFILELFLRPIRSVCNAIYRWVAPRNPLSISMRTYRRHVLRSNLTRMENPVGPSLEVPLEHAFAPLKVRSSTTKDTIDLFTYVAANRRCMILGGPGTGKTTLMKSLVTSVLRKSCHKDLNDLIPVFVVLRNLAKNQQTVVQAIVSSFDHYHFPGAENFVESSLEAGRLIIVLDGLDEVGANREFVVGQILNFSNHDAQRARQNRLLVTCREHSYKTLDLHDGIPDVLQVEPFTNHHMRIFLEGWPSHKGRLAIKLFAVIQDDMQLRDICRNPLLLTILTGLYLDTDNFEIPSSRERFYQNAVDELLVRRPARRQIRQQFNADDKRQILERVSLERLETVGHNEDPEELTQVAIREKAEAVCRTEKIDLHELLKELVDINGIIKPAQENSYTCAHRTILEYFAAREALRSRETSRVVKAFGDRPDLIEVLYFYCGLLKNLPALASIVRSFTAQSRWIEAGQALLHMNEAPQVDLVEIVSSRLHQDVVEGNERKESIELLSSLANRRDSEFETARRYFADAIDRLTASSDAGASALETAIAASPEIALKLVPGLLKHSSERWRAVGVQLLRDIGVDEALDKLVQLLNDDDPYVRRVAGLVLAEMIRSRNKALRQRAELLPERKDDLVWPLEKYFPGRLAIPIAEAVIGETSKSEAINYAVRALKSKANGQDDNALKLWRRIPLDVALRHGRRSMAGVFFLVGIFLVAAYLMSVVAIQVTSLLINRTIAVSVSWPPVRSVSMEPIAVLSDAAKIAFQEIQTSYPSAVGWRRFLPSNWLIPSVPESKKEAVTKLRNWSDGLIDPFDVVSIQGVLVQLIDIVTPASFELLRNATTALQPDFPQIGSKNRLVFGYHAANFMLVIVIIMATPVMYFVARLSDNRGTFLILSPSLFFKKHSSGDHKIFPPNFSYVAMILFLSIYATVFLPVELNWTNWAGPFLTIGFCVAGLLIYAFSWPHNSLLVLIDEVQGTQPKAQAGDLSRAVEV